MRLRPGPAGYHQDCIKLPHVPVGTWFCCECTNQAAILRDKVDSYAKAVAAEEAEAE